QQLSVDEPVSLTGPNGASTVTPVNSVFQLQRSQTLTQLQVTFHLVRLFNSPLSSGAAAQQHSAVIQYPWLGADLFSNCTEECKALGHSDRCWMPSFGPSDGRQGPDYRSNLHVPGMDSVPDTEVFESPELTADQSFSTFGKETPL
ncbi:hypothetical protein JOQ06_023477, partial [Pogonophryne albipinna]